MADNYGVTPQGFNRKRFPEIQEDLFNRLESKLGHAVSRKPNSVAGILVDLIAYASDEQWGLAEYDYYARSPVTADEGSIDNTLIYSNILRQDATHTNMFCVCYGRSGTILPYNCQIKGKDGERYNIDGASLITLNNCVNVALRIESVSAGSQYDVIIDDDYRISYEATAEDNVPSVYSKLLVQLTEATGWVGSVHNGNMVLRRSERRYGGNVVPSELFEVVEVGSPVRFIAENSGPINPPLNSVTTINTNYDGWFSVSNESEAYVGRERETTTELRQRYGAAVFRNSRSMKESIRAALLELPGVQNCTVFENRTDEIVDDMLPHSIEVIIHGGDDIEIAETILNRAPLGIDTNGLHEVFVTDSEGVEELVRFNRPVEIPVLVRITVYEYKEESLPGDMVNTIKKLVAEAGNSFGMGKDVIAQRFVGPIYKNVSGIGYLIVEVSSDGGKTYTQRDIPIDRGEVATFSVDDISVAMEL